MEELDKTQHGKGFGNLRDSNPYCSNQEAAAKAKKIKGWIKKGTDAHENIVLPLYKSLVRPTHGIHCTVLGISA